MNRDEAARLLGVAPNADAATAKRAFRMWALVAHPDAGGDRAHFARLSEARRVLLSPVPPNPTVAATARAEFRPAPRTRLRATLRVPPPAQVPFLALGALVAVSLAAVPGVAPAIGALLAGGASALWSAAVTWAVLRPAVADAGHRISVLAFTWLPLAAVQVGVSAWLGTQIALALPLLALPFAGVVAWVNAGAGLWRPIGPFDAPRQ